MLLCGIYCLNLRKRKVSGSLSVCILLKVRPKMLQEPEIQRQERSLTLKQWFAVIVDGLMLTYNITI